MYVFARKDCYDAVLGIAIEISPKILDGESVCLKSNTAGMNPHHQFNQSSTSRIKKHIYDDRKATDPPRNLG